MWRSTARHIAITSARVVAAATCATVSAAAACKPAESPTPAPAPKKKPEPVPPKSINEILLGLCAKGRHIFLTGTIDDKCAEALIAQLMYLEQEAPGVPIRLHINSGGGKVQSGLAIHDVMHVITSPVHTVCLGHCESMAAVLLAAGEPGQRYALPNARIMIHQPKQTSSGVSSNARQLAINAASIERSRRKLAVLLADRTGRPLEEILEIIEYDHVCDAEEAIALGLIDRLITSPGDLMPSSSGAPAVVPPAEDAEPSPAPPTGAAAASAPAPEGAPPAAAAPLPAALREGEPPAPAPTAPATGNND